MPPETTVPMTLTTTFQTSSEFKPAAHSGEASFQGHLSLQADDGESARTLRIFRFGAFSEGLQTIQGNTGPISITDLQGEGGIEVIEGRWVCRAAVTATVCYQAIEEEVGFITLPPDLFVSPPETFEGDLDLVLIAGTSDEDSEVLISERGRLHLVSKSTILGYVDELNIPLAGLTFDLRKASPGAAAPPTTKRTIQLRPIFFAKNDADRNPSGTSWQVQLDGARKLWSNCCIDFVPAPPVRQNDPKKKKSKSTDQLRKGAARVDPDAIEVVFTTGDIGGGGGCTYSPGCAHAVIVISDLYSANPYLLAHEIGHTLGAGHPRICDAFGIWMPAPGTVMEIPRTGGTNLPINKVANCHLARNPLLTPTGNRCKPRDTP